MMKIYKIIFLILKIFAALFFALVLVYCGVKFNQKHRLYSQCVKLPNGITIAPEAYFNFSRPYFMPGFVVKGPDGTVFSRGKDGIFHFSATTAYWTDYYAKKNKSDKLAYRPDVGLVRSSENRDLRKKLIREAGTLLEEDILRSTGVLGVWSILSKHPKYGSRDCSVPWFTVQKSYP